jgi:hypothetical protein
VAGTSLDALIRGDTRVPALALSASMVASRNCSLMVLVVFEAAASKLEALNVNLANGVVCPNAKLSRAADITSGSGVLAGLGLKLGHSCSDPATERRRGRSTASIKVRLSFDGLGSYASEAIGRAGKGFSATGFRLEIKGILCDGDCVALSANRTFQASWSNILAMS